MGTPIPKRHEAMAREPRCYYSDFQVFSGGQENILHHKCDWEPEFDLPAAGPPAERVPVHAVAAQGTLSGNFWGNKEMDNADLQPGKSKRWIIHHVSGQADGLRITHFLLLTEIIVEIIVKKDGNQYGRPSFSIIIEELNLQKKFQTLKTA